MAPAAEFVRNTKPTPRTSMASIIRQSEVLIQVEYDEFLPVIPIFNSVYFEFVLKFEWKMRNIQGHVVKPNPKLMRVTISLYTLHGKIRV